MQFLSDIMLDALRFFAYFGGYGWGIIWLTIAVNLALYPLTLSSIQSMVAMQRMQPRLAELQKKFKDKPQELQKETMSLYRSEGINPLGGCLPMILKIPFFLALFWACQGIAFMTIVSSPDNNTGFLWITGRIEAKTFKSERLTKQLVEQKILIKDEVKSKEGKGTYFVWNAVREFKQKDNTILLKDVLAGANENLLSDVKKVRETLSAKDKMFSTEETIKILSAWRQTGSLAKPDMVNTPFGAVSILAILIGITTFFMQKTMPSVGQQAQMMNMMMPVLLTFICWSFPAGVQIYWLISNIMAAVQQYYIMAKPKKSGKQNQNKIIDVPYVSRET
ncbi:YidC/Oxa1 family membrane protein insertase [Candidatus Saganbacteria bacterium]|nr:YidC/Oxa1 family membrane protein insertase [Candidatus Saganbacteria bacterium]